MGQGEIIKVLKKQKKFVDINLIHKKLNTARSSLNTSLKKLYDHGEVLRKQVLKNGHLIYEYKIKGNY